MLENSLKGLGLSENEAAVYVALLKGGATKAGRISRLSGVHRRNVYDALERLLEKGLVSYIIENNLKKFIPAPPSKLREIEVERLRTLDEVLPSLSKLSGASGEYDVRIYRGPQGLREILDDQIKTSPRKVLCFGATGRLDEIIGRATYLGIGRKRAKLGIKLKAIFNEGGRGSLISTVPNVECRFMPEEYNSFVPVWVYGNKVAIFVWAEEKPPLLAIMIENKKIADSFRNYFQILWRIANK